MNVTTPVAARIQPRRPRTWLRWLIMLAFVGLLAGGLIAAHLFKAGILKQVTAQIQHQLPTVGTATATMQPWQPSLTAVGSLRAFNGADLAAEVGGVVDSLSFESGQDVAAGAVLLRLRPNDDDAKLAQLQATAELDAVTLRRDQRQLAAQGVAQATVDSDLATLKVAQAQVAAQQALMAEKIVRAPFAGRLGTRLVDIGQYLAAGTATVTLQALDPMLIDFYLPQQALAQIAVGQTVKVSVDAYPGRTFAGTVTSFNAKVDSASRMLQVRATLHNPDRALLPGMFATATIDTGDPRPLVTIPNAAVAYNPYGSLVYVIHQENDEQGKPMPVARQQFVTTGAARGAQVSVLKGLAANDVVVTQGQLKLHNNAAVKIDNTIPIPDSPDPALPDR